MRQVQTAKRAMPPGAVALSAIKLPAGSLDAGASFLGFLEATADLKHPAVHLLRFRIFDLKVAPKAPAQEALNLLAAGIMFEVVDKTVISTQLGNGQGPFRHLAVTTVGQIN